MVQLTTFEAHHFLLTREDCRAFWMEFVDDPIELQIKALEQIKIALHRITLEEIERGENALPSV